MTATHALPIIMQFMEEGKLSGDIDSSLGNEAILAYFSAFGPSVKNPDPLVLYLFWPDLLHKWPK